MLASASQDSTVRLWRFTSTSIVPYDTELLQQEKQIFNVGSNNISATLEGVLAGHEGWVYGLHWHPPITNGNYINNFDIFGKISSFAALIFAISLLSVKYCMDYFLYSQLKFLLFMVYFVVM